MITVIRDLLQKLVVNIKSKHVNLIMMHIWNIIMISKIVTQMIMNKREKITNSLVINDKKVKIRQINIKKIGSDSKLGVLMEKMKMIIAIILIIHSMKKIIIILRLDHISRNRLKTDRAMVNKTITTSKILIIVVMINNSMKNWILMVLIVKIINLKWVKILLPKI